MQVFGALPTSFDVCNVARLLWPGLVSRKCWKYPAINGFSSSIIPFKTPNLYALSSLLILSKIASHNYFWTFWIPIFSNNRLSLAILIHWFSTNFQANCGHYFKNSINKINLCAWRQKIAILIRMQFLNDIIKSRHGFKTAQKFHKL